MREIAAGIGRGVISSSTIHNMFRGARLPKWGFLELVVEELHGDTAEFRVLWEAAQLADEAAGQAARDPGLSAPPGNGSAVIIPPEPDTQAAVWSPTAPPEPAGPRPSHRIWSNEIPQRNLHFTGRVAELQELRANLVRGDRPHPPAQLISGMGGVGKTEIATEYIHLHRDKYEIIWWIRAEHTDRVRDALVKLGQRLEVRPAGTESGRDRMIAAVLEALAGSVQPNWLLVYDNAAQPLDLQRYLPACPPGGHIIITSRLLNWPGFIEKDIVGISPFTEDEATDFLRRRVPALGANRRLSTDEDERRTSEAARLAQALGHLPIAVEHAAAYLTETGQTVDDYLNRFEEKRTFEDRRRILGPSDPRTLNSHDMVAIDLRGLGRYQESLDIARKVVGAFAAAGRRENPDWLNARTGFAAALRKAGHHWDALQESEEVVQRYRDYLGMDHALTLRAAANLINDRRAVGELAIAEKLGVEVCDRCRAVGAPVEILYAAMVNLASVLRVAGRPDEALRHDVQARDALVGTYGDQHPFTLAASINYATDLAACGDLAEAIRIGQDTLANCQSTLGGDHPDTLMAAVNLAIDVAASGNQARADRLLEDVSRRYAETLTTEHPDAWAAAQGARLTAEIEPY